MNQEVEDLRHLRQALKNGEYDGTHIKEAALRHAERVIADEDKRTKP